MISGLKWFFSKKEDNGNEISLKNALDELHKPDPYELVDEATLEKNRMSDAIKDFNCFSQLGESF